MALGLKQIETRSWPARYVGPIALHAAKRFDTAYQDICEQEPFRSALLSDPRLDPHRRLAPQLPRGKVLALARLDRWEMVTPETKLPEEPERSFGNYATGRYLFHFTHLHPLAEPFDAQGALGIWPLAVPEGLSTLLPALGEASQLLSLEQVSSLIVDDLREEHEQPRGRRRQVSRLATVDMTDTGLAHLHRIGQLLHLKPEWLKRGGPVPHSHHRMRAFFSTTDNRDEQGFRIYAVIGDIFQRPEILVRVGCEGIHCVIPATTVFELPEGLIDASAPPTHQGEDGDLHLDIEDEEEASQ